jgi:hypothetical protein
MPKSIFNKLGTATGSLAPAVTASAAYNHPRTLTASAARIDMKNKKDVDAIAKRRQQDKWQEEAWEYYDLIGEIKYVANLVSSQISRVNLYVGYVDRTSNVPSIIDDVKGLDPDFVQDANDIRYMLESGNGGTAGLLRTAALNLFIAGECWLVREPAKYSTGEPDRYQIRSVEEITATNGKNKQVAIKPRRNAKPADYTILPPNGFATRIWRNHGRFSDEADSSMRGVLDTCDAILQLDRSAVAAAKSRMNAGMLFIPDGLSNASQSDGDTGENGEIADLSNDVDESFEEELIAGFMTPVEDATSGASLIPTMVRGPQDLGEKIRHISFERSVDPQLNQLGKDLLDRLLSGLDIPKDIAHGMSSVKYSNAIIIEEQLYKAHIEPLILFIVDCLTIGFLRQALRKQGWPENLVNRAVVWYDPTAITAKPSKAEAAMSLYQMKLLGAEAVLRANGFAPEDGPTELERVQRMAEERAILSDAMSETLLDSIIPEELKNKAREQALAMSDPASANALQTALGGEPTAPEAGAPSDTIEPTQSNEQAPPTLMEP